MSEDLTFGVAIKGTGDGSMVSEAKAARDELVNLKQATDDLAASSAKLNASTTEDFAALQRSANAFALAWQKEQAAADAAADKAWALANGYKDVDGQLVKLAKSTEEATHMNAGMTREMMVLGHEAVTGNFSKIPGSLMVLANRSGLAASGMLGLGAAIAAPVLALGAFAVAAHEGNQEIEAMNRALALTGGYSGQTVDSLYALAHTLSDTTQLTIGQSKTLATQLAASGKIGAESFDGVAAAVAAYAQASGENVDKVTPKMIKLFSDPAKGAVELNSTMHFLTSTQLEHIATLEREGQVTQAQAELAELLTDNLKKQNEHVGWLASAWRGLGKAASSAWDSMESVGRESTLDEKIKKLEEMLSHETNGYLNLQRQENARAELLVLTGQKQKQISDANEAAATAKKITDEIEISNLAKQNSELWKKYEVQEKLARLTGGEMPDAPSADAVKQDAASNLDGSAKLLAQAKKFDEDALESHKDSLQKWVDKWRETEAKLIEAGVYGQKERERHEAAYTQYVTDENKKRNDANAKRLATELANENAYFDGLAAAAAQNTLKASGRENLRYEKEKIDLEKRLAEKRAKLGADNQLSESEEARFALAKENIETAHQTRITEIDRLEAEKREKNNLSASQAIISMSSQVASSAAGFLQATGQKNSEMAKIIFATQKGLAVAQAVINTELAFLSAMALGPAGWAIAPAIRTMGYISVGLIAATALMDGGGGTTASMANAAAGSGGAPATTPAPVSPPPPAPQQNQTPTGTGTAAQTATQINLTIVGAKDNPDAPLLSYNSFVNDVLPLMQQAKDNGHLIDFNVVMA